MTSRNIHGHWTMNFSAQTLYSKLTGPTNREAGDAWFEEMKQNILTSPNGDSLPWVSINDCRDWNMSSLDSWEANNTTVEWMYEHNCVLLTIVFSKKIHRYAFEKGLNDQHIVRFFYDYDEAYQACQDKLNSSL